MRDSNYLKYFIALSIVVAVPCVAWGGSKPSLGIVKAFLELEYARAIDDKCHLLSADDRKLVEVSLAHSEQLLASIDPAKRAQAEAKMRKSAMEKNCSDAKSDISSIMVRTRLLSRIQAMQADPHSNLSQWRSNTEAFALNHRCNFMDTAATNKFAIHASQERALFPEELKTDAAKTVLDHFEQSTIQAVNNAPREQACDGQSEKFVHAQAASQ